MHPECHPGSEVRTDLSHDQPLSFRTKEQQEIALRIIKSVLGNKHQLLFLQSSAGTGKTFTLTFENQIDNNQPIDPTRTISESMPHSRSRRSDFEICISVYSWLY
jgi:hypothetical protein